MSRPAAKGYILLILNDMKQSERQRTAVASPFSKARENGCGRLFSVHFRMDISMKNQIRPEGFETGVTASLHHRRRAAKSMFSRCSIFAQERRRLVLLLPRPETRIGGCRWPKGGEFCSSLPADSVMLIAFFMIRRKPHVGPHFPGLKSGASLYKITSVCGTDAPEPRSAKFKSVHNRGKI